MAPPDFDSTNKTDIYRLSARYAEALRAYMDADASSDLEMARDLGRQLCALDMETLDVARMHEDALIDLVPLDCAAERRGALIAHAAIFFTEAITPIEETHHAALDGMAQMHRLKETLAQRTLELADSHRELRLQISVREATTTALKTSELSSSQLLDESRLLEVHLHDIVRKILSANEEERRRMSHQLQSEIAQTLLGIHVRLLALKKEAAANHAGLSVEISTTQRLVEQSVKTINRLVREFGIQHQF